MTREEAWAAFSASYGKVDEQARREFDHWWRHRSLGPGGPLIVSREEGEQAMYWLERLGETR